MAAHLPSPATLVTLPFDVLYLIAQDMDFSNFVHLSRTCRAMYTCMRSELIARRIVENGIACTKEGHRALSGELGYLRAVGHRFDIQEALATASPYAVAMVAYAKNFVYQNGVLCYLTGHQIRVLDVHRSARQEHVLNLDDIVPRLAGPGVGSSILDHPDSLKLLGFHQGVVVFSLAGVRHERDTLIALDVTHRLTHRPRRLLLDKPLPESSAVVVRHSSKYLWYAFHLEDAGTYGTWVCCGYDLHTQREFTFTLDQMVTSYLGQNICFEIHDDYLYVVSTQNITNDDDDSHSSFFDWVCFAPRREDQKWSGRIWRREHREGPIDDLWMNLSIQKCPVTGRPMIVECRREWPLGGSKSRRTRYSHPLPTPDELGTIDPRGHRGSSIRSPCEDFVKDSRWESEVDPKVDSLVTKRLQREEHHENELDEDRDARMTFIYAHTKYHNYDFASSTFIDLVSDHIPQPHGRQMQDRLRLRAVSRKRRYPSEEGGSVGPTCGLEVPPTKRAMNVHPKQFVSRGVRMWPPENAPVEIHRLLTPTAQAGRVNAVSDDRSLIYSVACPGLPEHHQALVLISFDPSLRIPSMRPLQLDQALESTTDVTKRSSFQEMLAYEVGQNTLVKEARPMYEAIDRGFWLR
ncbi:hypothetical protein PDE_02063 [Penicillium oxalicum 114-2]|uniref:F-box domain-containing protein n=1 Tax=Penicillium oxalicum (strain 114-2 / CGMCC 5302) TaxID=933388 RepID=S7ZEL0_PENO1|nr:hypothetical protein PDE_02063 [Penicillium oxalicum 114-2]